jgi:hypothetical protein
VGWSLFFFTPMLYCTHRGRGKMEKKSRIHEFFFDKMTEEEKIQWRKDSLRKAQETRDKKKALEAERRKKAEELIPHLLAEDLLMIENESYTPRESTLNKVRELLTDPKLTFEELKRKYFSNMSQKGWEKLTKFLFAHQVSNIEDLGNQILQSRYRAIEAIKKDIRTVKREIKMSRELSFEKNKKKMANPKLLEMKFDLEKRLMEYQLDVDKTLHTVKFANEKKSGALSLHIHNQIPRPQPKDVTPTKVVLSEVLNGD